MIHLPFFLELIKSDRWKLVHCCSKLIPRKLWKFLWKVITLFFISLCSCRHKIKRKFRCIDLNFLTRLWNSGNVAIYLLPLWRIWLLRLHPTWSRNHDFVLNGEGVSLLRGKRFIVFLWCFRFLIEWIFKRFGHFVWNDGISPVVLLLVGCVILRMVNLLISVTWGRTMVFSKYLFHFFVVKIIFQFVVI